MIRRLAAASLVALVALATAQVAAAQHYQTDFPPDEFQARWAKLFDRIGEDAVAIVQATPGRVPRAT